MLKSLAPRRVHARSVSFALGASAFAVAIAIASPAAAQCSPDPTIGGGTTTCAGTDSDGLTVASNGTRVVVAAGAQVLPGAGAAAIVNTGRTDTYLVNGSIAGGSRPGMLLSNNAPFLAPCDPYGGAAVHYCPSPYEMQYPAGSAAITIAQGGAISGESAILLRRRSDNSSFVQATIDNAGSLTGTAAPALVAETGTSFLSVENRATGTINGISGAFQNVFNAGLIDGAGGSAITTPGQALVTNSGTITSNTALATMQGTPVSVTNSGTIRNDGSGAALHSIGILYVENSAGGVIATNGVDAIRATAQVYITNAGTITGSIIAGTGQYSGSMIDNLAGTINGSIQFGGSNDVLKARFDSAAGRIAGITGTIDGGAGMDQLQLGISADATLGQAALPVGFEQLSLQIANNSTVTVASANATANGILAMGSGRLVNTATLVTTGAAITTSWSNYDNKLDLENSGSITASLDSPYLAAVRVYPGSFTNSGSVKSNGGIGVQVSGAGSPAALLTNSGTIDATGTAASLDYVRLDNSGILTSTGGAGATLFRGHDTDASVNSGTISGATIGVSTYAARLVNSGTISGGTTGIVADDLRLDNRTGGVVRGGGIAIDGRNATSYGSVVRNAGTIVGTVDFTRNGYDMARDVFIDRGGVVEGALRMGGGDDLLVVDLGGAVNRPLAGATGGVDMGAGFDTIRYVAGTSQSATIAVPSGFDAVAYEVRDGATLALTAPDTLSTGLGFTGAGTIDLTANWTTSGTAAIDLGGVTSDALLNGASPPGYGLGGDNAGLTVISRGNIAFALGSGYYGGCAVAAAGADFENAGRITTSAAGAEPWSAPTAICGGDTVTNSGTIRIEGGTGVSRLGTFINRGTLSDVAGSGGTGVYRADITVNSGTIVTDGSAISSVYAPASITNSGTIESRTEIAIQFGFDGSVVNEASGVIRASETAIWGVRGEVINRGKIYGDVVLAGSLASPATARDLTTAAVATAAAPPPGSRYVADGGTLAGDLRFGDGDDVFVQTGAITGVSGIIDGGTGYDRIQLSTTGQGRFDGATGFERLDVSAGTWTLGSPLSVPETGIAAGATLIGTTTSLTGAIIDSGTLRIEQDFDASFSGSLQGNGALVKAGAGTVTMGDQLGFTGTTSVLGGRLLMSGRSAARLSVVGGTLGGAGTVGALAIGSGGTVSPGDTAIGTLTITGDFAQTTGSTYLATITAAGLSDRIVVGGTATLGQGARLALVGSVGGIGTRYTLLSAAGGLSGTYSTVEQPGGNYRLRIVYSPTSVFADVARSAAGLAGLANSANQRATALGLNGLPDSNAAYAAVTLEANEAAARAALDTLSGEVHASLGTAMVQDARIVEDAVLTRTLSGGARAGLWGTMIGSRGTDDGDAGAAALRRASFGGVGGVDLSLGGARIGLAGGYTRSDLTMNQRGSDGRSQTLHLLGYGGGTIGAVSLRAGVGYAWADTRIDRHVVFAGVNERLRADYDGGTLYSFLEAGHGFAVGGGSLQPYLGFEAYRVKTDAFAETGGSAALRGAARTESSAFAKLGVRAETPIVEGLRARANAGWLRRVDGAEPRLRQAFVAGGAGFEVGGAPLSRNAGAAGIDLVWSPSPNVRIVSGYNGRIGSKSDDSSFRVAANIGF
ncbi:autotransporter domain-containing protein [Sphingomonas sp. CJ20]